MDIKHRQRADSIELIISGRLDAHWAEDLDREIAGAVQGGARQIDLDMAAVDYISSTGIRVLLKYWKQLKTINGVFRIISPSEAVRKIVAMSGMDALFEASRDFSKSGPTSSATPATEIRQADGGRFTIYRLHPDSRLSLQLIGRPELLGRQVIADEDVTAISLPREALALGLGAFGEDCSAVRVRGGEFLAAGGAAICLPTDGAGRPDDQIAAGEFIPRLQALYALRCEGRFRHFFSFAPDGEGGAPLPLSLLVETAFSVAGAPAAGFVFICETGGLVGATLRRPPVEQGGASPFSFPEVRNWFSLTTERVYPQALALVVGVAAAGDPALAPFLRPLGGSRNLTGHIHAAALSYRALPGGLLDLSRTVAELLETQSLRGVLHLINDSRPIAGIGESLFIRGAAWVSPLDFNPAPPASGNNEQQPQSAVNLSAPPREAGAPGNGGAS